MVCWGMPVTSLGHIQGLTLAMIAQQFINVHKLNRPCHDIHVPALPRHPATPTNEMLMCSQPTTCITASLLLVCVTHQWTAISAPGFTLWTWLGVRGCQEPAMQGRGSSECSIILISVAANGWYPSYPAYIILHLMF